jgi:hypothetical protein
VSYLATAGGCSCKLGFLLGADRKNRTHNFHPSRSVGTPATPRGEMAGIAGAGSGHREQGYGHREQSRLWGHQGSAECAVAI